MEKRPKVDYAQMIQLQQENAKLFQDAISAKLELLTKRLQDSDKQFEQLSTFVARVTATGIQGNEMLLNTLITLLIEKGAISEAELQERLTQHYNEATSVAKKRLQEQLVSEGLSAEEAANRAEAQINEFYQSSLSPEELKEVTTSGV